MEIHYNGISSRNDAAINSNAIFQSAIVLFKEKGLNATIEEIANHAGVGVGTVYRNFGSKNKLATTISSEILNEIYNKQMQIIASDLPIEEKLIQIFSTYTTISSEFGEIHQMIVQLLTNTSSNDPIRDDWMKKLQHLYKKLIEYGQKEGIFSKENTYVQEMVLMNTVNPLMVKEISAQLPIDKVPQILSEIVLNGLIIRK